MVILLGESASGKSTIQNLFIEKHPEYKKVITYTTRPIRDKEVDGTDYHFISKDTFQKLDEINFFAEKAEYNGWFYGTARRNLVDDKAIAVLTPAGFRKLKGLGIDIIAIYLCTDRRSRLIKALKRGDDIEEAYRRNLSDAGQFDGLANEADYTINNIGFQKDTAQVIEEMEKCLKERIR